MLYKSWLYHDQSLQSQVLFLSSNWLFVIMIRYACLPLDWPNKAVICHHFGTITQQAYKKYYPVYTQKKYSSGCILPIQNLKVRNLRPFNFIIVIYNGKTTQVTVTIYNFCLWGSFVLIHVHLYTVYYQAMHHHTHMYHYIMESILNSKSYR